MIGRYFENAAWAAPTVMKGQEKQTKAEAEAAEHGKEATPAAEGVKKDDDEKKSSEEKK